MSKYIHSVFSATIIIGMILLPLSGCKKFLDKKSDSTLATAHTLEDLQALMDNYGTINSRDILSGEVSADDYYLTENDWMAMPKQGDRRMYTWTSDYLFDDASNDWSNGFSLVYYANTVLEKIGDIKRGKDNAAVWDNVKGQALFIKAKAYLQLAAVFCLAYDSSSSGADLGLPLRNTTDFNEQSVRASLRETYSEITTGLQAAASLLPEQPLHAMRASKAAAHGLLARTYLWMRKYNEALKYADSCLKIKNGILDYSSLSASKTYPLPPFNSEVIYSSMAPPPRPLSIVKAKIVNELYSAYGSNDVRRQLFFRPNPDGSVGFRGSYNGNPALFCGPATDEMLLIHAECSARNEDLITAGKDMDGLLKYRITGYTGSQSTDKKQALQFILTERRKELLMRGLRWMDVKRLNKEGANISLQRTIGAAKYSLPPNDPRFALPVPEDAIAISGMQQNPR